MSQSDSTQTPGDTTSYAGLRVGDAERKAAITALGEHWQAGRLDPAEHERRTTAAFSAATRGDLDALFTDLAGGSSPAAGVVSPAASGPVVGSPAAPAGPAAPATPAAQGGFATWLSDNRGAVASLVPLLAVLMFFLTKQWVFFLLIPIAYTLIGTVRGDGHGRDRHRNRRGGC